MGREPKMKLHWTEVMQLYSRVLFDNLEANLLKLILRYGVPNRHYIRNELVSPIQTVNESSDALIAPFKHITSVFNLPFA